MTHENRASLTTLKKKKKKKKEGKREAIIAASYPYVFCLHITKSLSRLGYSFESHFLLHVKLQHM
jgi:uncharacterized protein Veg